MSVTDFEKKHKANGFVFMSAAKKDLRSEGKGFTLFGKEAGETVLRSENGKISSLTVSVYNRGDDGAIGLSAFNDRRNHIMNEISTKTKVRPRDMSQRGTVKLDRQLWMWDKSALLLEKSISRDGKNAEFLRLRMKPKNADKAKIANRSSLKSNVVEDRASGDVFIEGVPMVDQGRKGYCAVASAARVYQYYGLEVDQHELAQIAGTGPGSGTSLGEMVASLKKVTRHVHSKVLVLYEYPTGLADKMPDGKSSYQDYDRVIRNYNRGLKEFARDVKSYNKIAKKQGKTEFRDDVDEGVVSRQQLSRECDKDIYRSVMVKKSSYSRFKNKIYTYIDQGVPVGWCLQLGMFKEENLPQAFGGHMRLIIGYNKKTDELIYTDSWGAGHGKKRMPVPDAFCMTSALLALPPTK
ncbi:C39 family peptidase [Verrucomicrobiaceae bacterium N1E253]|uniref:C39 family peptidase n=2 Tax=Oceaniferula marina TaxID=2748318 RepID=A0A851GDQ8_9BACT|nr:C39 family peptidase [Oceaniferula marina]